MDCRTASCLLFILVFSLPLLGQEQGARKILDLSEADQIAFITSTIDQGFPEDRADQMTMLLINRSALTVPLIETKLEETLKSEHPSKNFIDVATEMIAYAGDEQSLRAISKLLAIDEKRFGRLVGRTLGNSMNWRNPFTVAYRAFEMGDDAVARYTVAWSESALSSDRMKHVWAEAMLNRYGKVPSQAEWAQDPLASRLKPPQGEQLRESVMRFAAEARSKRERQ